MAKNVDQLELADLKSERVPAPPAAPQLSPAELSSVASEQLRQDVTVTALQMELTARHPYDAAGLMDFYQPGRWDATSNLVYMIPDTGSTVTFGYGQFTAQAAGNHLVVLNFNGYQVTLRASGPWGTVSAYSPTASGNVAVTALWNATAGATLYFSFSCTGVGLAYLSSVQVHSL
jgi:hypothetical protein